MGAAVAVVHAPHHAPGLARASVVSRPILTTGQAPDADETPSRRVRCALAVSGLSQDALAARVGVSQTIVGRWCDDAHPSLPNVGHLAVAPASFVRPLAEGLLADLDAREPVLPVAAFEREMLTIVTEMGAVYGKATAFLAVGDRASALALAGHVGQLRDRLRRLERAAMAAASALERSR